MTERHLSVQPQQALRLHGCSRCLRDSKLVRGAPQKRRVTDRLGGGQEEKPTRVAWEPREPPAEALLDPRGQRQRRRQVESARQLPGGQPAWELQECERVAPGFGNDALENGFVQTSREDGLQERPCIPTAQRIDTELRKAEQATSHVASRERERDPLREQPTRDERERGARCVIEPLRVVDHAQERLLLGRFGEETENGEPDEERARRLSRAQPECDVERVTLRVGKTFDQREERRAELEQRRFANSWVAVHHEDTAVALARRLQQPLEHRLLALSAEQPLRLCARDHPGSMPLRSRTKDFLDSIAWARRRRWLPQTPTREGVGLTTAIIGVGHIGSALARHLVDGGESVALAAKDESRAEALAQQLGPLARAGSEDDVINGSDV